MLLSRRGRRVDRPNAGSADVADVAASDFIVVRGKEVDPVATDPADHAVGHLVVVRGVVMVLAVEDDAAPTRRDDADIDDPGVVAFVEVDRVTRAAWGPARRDGEIPNRDFVGAVEVEGLGVSRLIRLVLDECGRTAGACEGDIAEWLAEEEILRPEVEGTRRELDCAPACGVQVPDRRLTDVLQRALIRCLALDGSV